MASINVDAQLEFDAEAIAPHSMAANVSVDLLGDHLILALVPVTETAAALGDILDDAIFGEELDISDLIPALLSADPGSNISPIADINAVLPVNSYLEAAAQLNVLFDEEETFAHGAI